VETDLATLLTSAATTLVKLMTTDSWTEVKAGFVALWQRHHPEQAEAIEADLEASRASAVVGRQDGDGHVEAELAAEWRSRLRRLAEANTELQGEIRRLMEELRPLIARSDNPSVTVVMRARSSGSSRIYQAGHDQTVTGE